MNVCVRAKKGLCTKMLRPECDYNQTDLHIVGQQKKNVINEIIIIMVENVHY